ncbi:hypothetical protein BZK24_08880, partial [Helicobacter pylori]
ITIKDNKLHVPNYPIIPFIVGLALGLAPIAGSVAVLGAVPLWAVFLAFGVVLWVGGFDFLFSFQVME